MVPSIDLLRRFVNRYPEYVLSTPYHFTEYFILDPDEERVFAKIVIDDDGFIVGAQGHDLVSSAFRSFSEKLTHFLIDEYDHRAIAANPPVPRPHIPTLARNRLVQKRLNTSAVGITYDEFELYGTEVIAVSITDIPYVRAMLYPSDPTRLRLIGSVAENTAIRNEHPLTTLIALRVLLNECLASDAYPTPSQKTDATKTLPPIVIGA